jgi:hypothetical protein
MAKRQVTKTTRQRIPAPPTKAGLAPALSSTLNRQMRKVLGKHYRAKYGVK